MRHTAATAVRRLGTLVLAATLVRTTIALLGRGPALAAAPARAGTVLVPRNYHPTIQAAVISQAAHVRLQGLTVTGPTPCGAVAGIVAAQSSNLDLIHTRFANLHPGPAACAAQQVSGRAVAFALPPSVEIDGRHGSPGFGRITHDVVDGYLSVGIDIGGPSDAPSQVMVTDSIVLLPT